MDHRLTIKKWAEEDRPREKLLLKGKSVLSDAELIAILIGSGNKTQSAVDLAQYILNQYNNDLDKLAKLSVKELQKFNGIGEAKAISIVSALEIGRRRKEIEPKEANKILSPQESYDFIRENLVDLSHEEFWLIYLKRNHRIIKKERISIGGISSTVVDPKVIFKKVLEEAASSIILAHNHPSGNLKPSEEDIRLTKKMKEAGNILDVKVLDHLIITDHSYYSFAANKML